MAPVLSRTPARRLLALLPSPHSTAHTLVASSSAWRWRAPRTAARGTWVQPERGGSRGFSVFPANRGVFRPWINASEQDELEYRDMHLEAPLHRGVGKEDMTRSLPPLMGATLFCYTMVRTLPTALPHLRASRSVSPGPRLPY